MKPIAQHIDELRLFPRLFLVGYGWLVIKLCLWAMTLPDISTQQSILVGGITAIFAPLVSFYTATGTKWSSNNGKNQSNTNI